MKNDTDRRVWIYHQVEAPKGVIVNRSETEKLFPKGWVDTPAKFGKGIRGKWYKLIIFSRTEVKRFWLKYWQWIITFTATTILGVASLYLLAKSIR